MRLRIRQWLMATILLPLPFQTACEGKDEADVVPELNSRNSEAGDNEALTIKYIPGSKLIVQGTGGRPVITADPTLVCNNIEFYNADGELVWGTANCSSHFEDPNLTPENIKAGISIFGVTGNVIESPGACGSNGSQSCVATGSYFAAEACAADDSQCYLPNYVASSQPLKAIDYDVIRNLTPENIKAGISIFGVTGNVIESPGACGSNGSQSCVATGSYFAAEACAANGSQCYLPNYVAGSQPLKAIDYDVIDADKMLTTQSIDGKTGRIATHGSWDLKTTYPGAGYYSGTTNTPAAANILSGNTILGVAGSAKAAPADCNLDGATGCVAVANFPAVDKSLITAGNIRRGVRIVGTTGNFPSSASPLPRYSDTGATTNVWGSDISDLTNFTSQVTTNGSFEYWSSTGLRGTGSGDSDLVAGNVRNTVVLENFSITGTHVGAGNCTADGQTECTTTTRYKSVDTEALTTWDIRGGKSAGGISGSIEFYKNMAKTSVFNRTTGTGSAEGLDVYDTVDDRENPTQNPGGWPQATGANWTEVVGSTVYKDNITGLVWLKDQGNFNWEAAITQCHESTAGSRSDWRLPTQKELMQAYTNRIWTQRSNLSLSSDPYWSATTDSYAPSNSAGYAWMVQLNHGRTDNYPDDKSRARRVVCVAP